MSETPVRRPYAPSSPRRHIPSLLPSGYRRAVRLQLGGAGLDVEPSCPDAHGAGIGASASGVDTA
jgi:hypothetical protein